MNLFIDTTKPDRILLKFGSVKKIVRLTDNAISTKLLLPNIVKIIEKQNKNFQNISGIAVVNGPGPFTSVRVGIVTANTLALLLKIPIISIRSDRVDNFKDFILKAEKMLKNKKIGVSIVPYYGRPPHLTKSKKKRAKIIK
ncbi:hypothetical protein ACFL04_01620 [Patescibacteria group bacterium]